MKFRWLVDGVEAGFDDQAPYLQNRDPAPSSTDQLDTALSLEIVDDSSGVDLATVLIEINVDAGGWQNVYASSAFVDPYDDASTQGAASPNGYSFNIVPDTALGYDKIIQVRVTADDTVGNTFGPSIYQYQTGVPPYVSLRDPGIGEANVPLSDPITVRARDDGSGMDQDSIQVDVEGVVAYDHDGGGFQGGFTGTYSEVAAGLEYEVSIVTHPTYVEGQVIDVRVRGADNSGFTLDSTESFTYRDEPPFVDGQNPAPAGVAPADTNIFLRVRDLDSGVNLTTVLVEIQVDSGGYQTAYTGSTDTFSSPYNGPGSARTPIADGQELDIDPSSDFAVGSAIQVRVSASDVDGNVMPPVVYAFDINDGPSIFDLFPPDLSTGALTTTDVGFKTTDPQTVDPTSLDMTIDGTDAVVDGVAQLGYTLTMTPIVDGYDVVVELDADLDIGTTHSVTVSIADALGVPSQTTWSFETELGIVEDPVLRAVGGDSVVNLLWTLPPPDVMLQELFQLRRSTVDYPTTPGEGELVYEGTEYEFEDTDVVNGTTYYYTVFVVRRHVSGQPVYVPYGDPASDSARPRAVVAAPVVYQEYVPVRGDFGTRTVDPLPQSQTLSVWSRDRLSDIVRTSNGKPVLCPVRGNIRSMVTSSQSAGGQTLMTVEIETPTGLVLSLDGFIPSPTLVSGQMVEAGQPIGRAVSGTMFFEVYKLPTGGFGRRTVRPRYFYLTVEKRDGRA